MTNDSHCSHDITSSVGGIKLHIGMEITIFPTVPDIIQTTITSNKDTEHGPSECRREKASTQGESNFVHFLTIRKTEQACNLSCDYF